MKKLLITSALATALASGSVLANPAAQQGDLDQIFAASGKAGQVAALSHQEMKETEGEWWPVVMAGIGAGASTIGYLANTRNPTWGGGLRAAGWGAVGGLGGGVGAGARAAYTLRGFQTFRGATGGAYGAGSAGLSQWW